MTGDTWTHDNNARHWRVNNHCHWAEYNERGIRIAQGTHRLCTPTVEELARWDETISEIIARAERADLPSALYLRWGNPPRGGRSKNHATGELEAGVSVYGARYNPVTDLIEYAEDGTGCHAALTYLLSGAPCYLVTGAEIGRGSDGEPVLKDVCILANLEPREEGFAIKAT